MKSLAISMLAAFALLPLDADATPYTYVQSNGVECNPANTSDQGVLTYGWGGIRNPSAFPATVICPITRASADSIGAHNLPRAPIEAFVYFSGADLTCTMHRYTSTGAIQIKNMTKDTDWPAASRMRGRLEVADLASTLFEYVYCTVPSNTVIRGMISYQELRSPSSGGISAAKRPFPDY